MRRVVVVAAIVGLMLGLLALASSPAQAGWVWRGGQWQYVDEKEPPPAPPPPPPERPKPAPIKPAPEPPKPPPAEPKPPPTPPKPSVDAPKPKPKPPAPEETPPPAETQPPAVEPPAEPETPVAPPKPPVTRPKPPTPEVTPPPTVEPPPEPETPLVRPPQPLVRPRATNPPAEKPAVEAPTVEKPAVEAPAAEKPPVVEKPPAVEKPGLGQSAEAPAEPAFTPQPAQMRWWWQRPEDPNADRHLFEAGRNAYARKDYGGAAATFKTLIKQDKESQFRLEAMWLRAEALYESKDYYHAFEQYEELVTTYAGSPHYHDALVREMEVAELFFSGVKRRVLGMFWVPAQTEAVEILRKVYEHQPTGDLAPRSVIRVAHYYWDQRQWQSAEDYYDKYCREYPNGADVRTAELRRAKCALERCRGAQYDTTCLKLCRDRLEQFQQKYPGVAAQEGVPAMLDGLHSMQAEAMFRTADWYHRTGQTVAAAHYFEEVQAQYADTPWGGMAEAELNKMKGVGGK